MSFVAAVAAVELSAPIGPDGTDVNGFGGAEATAPDVPKVPDLFVACGRLDYFEDKVFIADSTRICVYGSWSRENAEKPAHVYLVATSGPLSLGQNISTKSARLLAESLIKAAERADAHQLAVDQEQSRVANQLA